MRSGVTDGRRIAALLSCVAVITGLILLDPASAANAATPSRLFGVSVQGLPDNLTPMESFQTMVERKVNLANYYVDFTTPNFDAAAALAIANLGVTPVVTWQPMNGNLPDPIHQPAYSLRSIIHGQWDSLISTWAIQIAAWGRPVMLRFAHEMNGNWYPWSIGVNGNTAVQYVQAWRHVHDVFVARGATKVKWIWSPNTDYPGSAPLRQVYPGDAYVDYIGIDGYNWGTSQSWSGWQTPQQLFNPTIVDVHSFTHRPVIITEVSSSERGGSKANWINQFFAWLKGTPAVIGFVWFEFNKETNWLVESSPGAKAAFIADLKTI